MCCLRKIEYIPVPTKEPYILAKEAYLLSKAISRDLHLCLQMARLLVRNRIPIFSYKNSRHSHKRAQGLVDTGRRRPTGCLELQVSFCKTATKHRALLQKETYKHKAACGSSPPCTPKKPCIYGSRLPYLYMSFSAKEPYN